MKLVKFRYQFLSYVPVLDTELVSNDVAHPTNEESEPSPCKQSSPVILRQSLRNRKPVDRLNL